tara:strand:+ start:747 stop:977 length:231 start_codon:yes stop_codon:yes gene_type:complete
MKEIKKEEVKRELIMALMVLVLFVSLVVTWTILGAIDEYSSNLNSQKTENNWPEMGGTGMVTMRILPQENIEGEDS